MTQYDFPASLRVLFLQFLKMVYSDRRTTMKIKTKSIIILILCVGLVIPTLSYAAKVAGTVIAKQGEVKVLHQGETEWKDILSESASTKALFS